MKPLGAEWMVALHSHIKNNPDLVKNGFKEAGISEKYFVDCNSDCD